jgi:serine phosphatase RsbU (regulator of sigma subunit)
MYIAAADCTGHGVPGAFMSMLGISLLDNIIAQEVADTAGGILDKLREQIIHSLKQRGIEGEQKDGMDMIFIIFDERTRKIQYAGANNHLFLIPKDKKELKVIKADRMPVAIYEFMDPFSTRVIQLRKGDTLYMASDGYQDQFGGPNGKKFYSKYLKELLVEICERPMADQKAILDKTIEEWKNNYEQKYEQTDDITIVGIRIA